MDKIICGSNREKNDAPRRLFATKDTMLVLESAIRPSNHHRFIGFRLVYFIHACFHVETDRRNVFRQKKHTACCTMSQDCLLLT